MVLCWTLFFLALSQETCPSGEDECLLDLDDDDYVALMQTRAFLERPPLTVEEGIEVELHAVERKAERELEHELVQEHHTASKAAQQETESLARTAARAAELHETTLYPTQVDLAATKEATVEAATEALLNQALVDLTDEEAAPSDVIPEVEAEEPPDTTWPPSQATEGTAPDGGAAADVVLREVGLNVTSNDTGIASKMGVTASLDPVNLKILATLVVEGTMLLFAEVCRRVWMGGAVEASAVVESGTTIVSAEAGNSLFLFVFGFPMTLLLLNKCCGRNKQGETTDQKADRLLFSDTLLVDDDQCQGMEDYRCVFDSVGCALEQSGHQGTVETVSFRSLAINSTGLAYTALGQPRSAGRWRIELLNKGREQQAHISKEPTAPLDTVLVGVLPDQDVSTAAEELAGHWAFVSASRGRGFAYSPSGRAVRRGVETHCAESEVDAVLELVLDAPKRSFEVFRTPADKDALPELLCSFGGIRSGSYRLAVSLRCGGIRVTDLSGEADA